MRGIRKSTQQLLIVALICVCLCILAFGAAFYIGTEQIESKYEEELEAMTKEIDLYQKEIFITEAGIHAGDVINEKNTTKLSSFTQTNDDQIFTTNDFGKVAKIEIPAGSEITKSMLTDQEIQSSLREEEFFLFTLNTNLTEKDTADIRIMFPNGENYIVLTKKKLKGLSLVENKCYLWLDEEEILKISSAIVDAYLHDAKIYTSKYVEPLLQDSSIVTYQPNEEVMLLMVNDPNVLEKAKEEMNLKARRALEERLLKFEEKTNGQVNLNNNLDFNSQQNQPSFEVEDKNENEGEYDDKTDIPAEDTSNIEDGGDNVEFLE